MSCINAAANTSEIALTANTAKTVLQIKAAANHRVKLLSWGVSFDGTVASNQPVVVELLRQTTAGTATTLTPVKLDESLGETLQTTASHTATAEPTAGNVLSRVDVHPQGGYEFIFPIGQEIILAGNGRLGIRCTAPEAVNVIGKMQFEE